MVVISQIFILELWTFILETSYSCRQKTYNINITFNRNGENITFAFNGNGESLTFAFNSENLIFAFNNNGET